MMRAGGSLRRRLHTVWQKNSERIGIDWSSCCLLTFSVTFIWLRPLCCICGLNRFELLIAVNCVAWVGMDEWLYVTAPPGKCLF